MQNYRKIRKISLKWAHFMYMDYKGSYIGDSLFVQEKCPVEFLEEYDKKDTNWVMIHVKVRKKDVPAFTATMAKFRNTAILKGHTDYDRAFKAYWVPFMEMT